MFLHHDDILQQNVMNLQHMFYNYLVFFGVGVILPSPVSFPLITQKR